MAEIIRAFSEALPTVTLVGKVYHLDDKDEHDTFTTKWNQWFDGGLFTLLESKCKNADSGYVGAMRMNGKVFEYWIGILAEAGSAVPEGFDSADIPAASYGTAWIRGVDGPELYCMHEKCMEAFGKEGLKIAESPWYIERYTCPRFTVPDAQSRVILDYSVTLVK